MSKENAIQTVLQNQYKPPQQTYPMLNQEKEKPDSVWDNFFYFT